MCSEAGEGRHILSNTSAVSEVKTLIDGNVLKAVAAGWNVDLTGVRNVEGRDDDQSVQANEGLRGWGHLCPCVAPGLIHTSTVREGLTGPHDMVHLL